MALARSSGCTTSQTVASEKSAKVTSRPLATGAIAPPPVTVWALKSVSHMLRSPISRASSRRCSEACAAASASTMSVMSTLISISPPIAPGRVLGADPGLATVGQGDANAIAVDGLAGERPVEAVLPAILSAGEELVDRAAFDVRAHHAALGAPAGARLNDAHLAVGHHQ